MRLGVIADTHGRLRPEVLKIFSQVDRILHAGDVGGAAILEQLGALAPVTAVYGNIDGGTLRSRLPRVADLRIDDFHFVLTHGDQFGSPTPEALKEAFPLADVMIYGHSHRPLVHSFEDFSVALNPGAAGPARFDLLPSVAIVETEPGIPPRARIVPLTV